MGFKFWRRLAPVTMLVAVGYVVGSCSPNAPVGSAPEEAATEAHIELSNAGRGAWKIVPTCPEDDCGFHQEAWAQGEPWQTMGPSSGDQPVFPRRIDSDRYPASATVELTARFKLQPSSTSNSPSTWAAGGVCARLYIAETGATIPATQVCRIFGEAPAIAVGAGGEFTIQGTFPATALVGGAEDYAVAFREFGVLDTEVEQAESREPARLRIFW